MSDRDKDVMIYHNEPSRRIYLVSLHLENKPGALGNLADQLAVRGMNILEGFFGGMSYGPNAVLSFFVETTNKMMDEGWLKDYLTSSVYASDVEVKGAVEGFLADSVNFPLTWNSGDRAVLMRINGIRRMLNTILEAQPKDGPKTVYDLGFNYGKDAWKNLMETHRPKTKEGLAEMLKIYNATGWGRAELVELDVKHMKARVHFSDSFECSPDQETKGSNLIRGHIAGAFSSFFQTDVNAVEHSCASRGDDHCDFEVQP